MTLHEVLPLLGAFVLGSALGAFFFGGLWWTLKRALASPRAWLWQLASLLLRSGVTVFGFWAVGAGSWQRLLACLLGFVVARAVVLRITQPPRPEPRHAIQP